MNDEICQELRNDYILDESDKDGDNDDSDAVDNNVNKEENHYADTGRTRNFEVANSNIGRVDDVNISAESVENANVAELAKADHSFNSTSFVEGEVINPNDRDSQQLPFNRTQWDDDNSNSNNSNSNSNSSSNSNSMNATGPNEHYICQTTLSNSKGGSSNMINASVGLTPGIVLLPTTVIPQVIKKSILKTKSSNKINISDVGQYESWP